MKTATKEKLDKPRAYPGRSKGLLRIGHPTEHKSPRLNDDGLTEKQSLYVDEFLLNGGNSYQAAIKAGYSVKTVGSESVRLARHPRIIAAIAKKQSVARHVSSYTIEDHARELGEQRLLALADKQHTAAAKLLELQGKLRGFYTERLEITHKYEQMSDEELRIKVMALQQDQDGVWHHPIHHIESGHE